MKTLGLNKNETFKNMEDIMILKLFFLRVEYEKKF